MVRRADAVANQEKILVAAKALFSEKGISAEIKEIAVAAGVGVGTIYRSYADRDGLVTAITRESINEFAALAENCLRQPDAKLALYSFVRQGLAHSESYGWLIAAALGWQLPHEAMMALAESDVAGQIRKVIERAVQDGTLRDDAPQQRLGLQVLGHLLLWSYRTPDDKTDIDTAAAEVMDLLLRGAGVQRS